MADSNRTGFVGLGNMGGPMATSIAKAGRHPMVYDLRKEAVRTQVSHGAVAATSLAELIQECDIIGTCLLHDHQVKEAFLGENGIVALGRPGQIAMIHSTVLPQTVLAIAAAAKEKGIGIVDAPVSGGGARSRESALEGTLTLMVGAEDWAWEKARPILEIVGANVIRVGAPGAGQVVKLGNNIMALCNQVLHMEAIRFVQAYGVTREALDTVARVSSGDSWAVANYEFFDKFGVDHTMAGPELSHVLGKDIRYAVAVAQEQATYLPAVALCSQLLPGMFEERWANNKRRGSQ
ncbi:NAD(P)-dependent oxidoreductase [Bordetella sp. BOR01]|uniref:NAD(P)-dependent oxidoreductase n=1 Tax=Bordetella sp. BOR01 TaxID=2854779 RepID=UPI001C4701D2|nr:NAD(P)-dependent oxidoreductase [Bordetella sp. BOR01]MBV7485548.1 NAD(P)-dependent oxidoreductase [Bordetella sp. BOR01]